MSSKQLSLNDFKFFHPFTMIVSGMTQSGKTEFTANLLRNLDILSDINKDKICVLWCFKQKHPTINKSNLEIIYFNNIPDITDLKRFKPDIIILDDLMSEISANISDLFTIDSHALNISVIFIVQNLFNKNKFMRTISLNTHYFVLMRGLRNESQIEHLGRQIFNRKSKKLLDIFREVTKEPYSYLIIDLHPKSKPEIAVRTRTFPGELNSNLAKFHSFAPIYFNL